MNTIVPQLREQFPFSVSTDNAGLFGNPQSAIAFWEQVTSAVAGHPVSFGLELLAWRHLPMRAVLNIPEVRERFAGCHGRIGTRIESHGSAFEQAVLKKKIWLYNNVLHPSISLLQTMAATTEDWSQKPYLLMHEPEIDLLLQDDALTHAPRAIPIGVENNIDDPNLSLTRGAVSKLQSLGFEAVPVFDLAHFLTCHDSLMTPSKTWDKLLAQFSEQMMVHIPIGFNVSDSLHFEHTSDSMLRELAAAIRETKSYCTLEFQLAGIWPLYAQPTYLPYVTQYATDWLRRLFATGVISAR